MGMDWTNLVQKPNYDAFARPVQITPLMSQPGGAAYAGRGIFDTDELDYVGLDGSIISNSRTILDIIISEYTVTPVQQDLVYIPPDPNTDIEGGNFEVLDISGHSDGGGELTLTLRKIMPPLLLYPLVEDYFLGSPTFDTPDLTVSS